MSKLPTTTSSVPPTTTSTSANIGIPAPMALPSMLPSSNSGVNTTTVDGTKAVVNPNQLQRTKMQNVPAFLNKLYNMVDDPSSDDLIRWADDGMSFLVLRHEDFAKRVLPRFFKHSNFSSFVRQLNMYGFHKVPHLQQGVLHADSDAERWEFSNPHFQRNQPDLLLLVTRKKGRDTEEKETGNIDMHNILDEIAAIKKHQMSISADLKGIQRDNQVLWQETLAARERHHRHQETIDKILRFLASVFSSDKKRVVIPRKRRMLIGDANTEYKDEDFLEEEEEDDRPAKVARHFNIDEYINGNQGNLSSSSTGLPYTGNADDALANAASSDAPATELAAAIALNDETKQQQKQLQQQQQQQQQQMQMSVSHLPPSTEGTAPSQQHHQQPDLSSTLNFQQLQSIIALVQANPALLSQLGGDALFNPHIPQQVDYNGASFNDDSKPSTQQLTSPSPTPVQSTYPVSTVTPLTSSSPSLPQVTNNITTVAKSADAINQDIDALGASLGLLASQLGFDPSKADFGSINMDDFLNTAGTTEAAYTVDSPSASNTPVDQGTPSSTPAKNDTTTSTEQD